MRLSFAVTQHRGARHDMAEDDDPYLIAVEQYLYWRELGLSHEEMLAAVEIAPPPHLKQAETVIRWLAFAYRARVLHHRRAA